MPERVRFSIRLPHSFCTAGARAIEEVAEAADGLGFWGVSAQDHFLQDPSVSPCGHAGAHAGDDRTAMEPLGVLAYAAARTKTVRLLTSVVVLPLHNPLELAKQVATLDVLSGGRVTLGVGVGAQPEQARAGAQDLRGHAGIAAAEFGAFGVGRGRGGYADEALAVMDALWTQDRASFAGPHFRFDGLAVRPHPVQRPRPPVWVGGRSDAAQRRAGRLGDGWIPSQCPVDVFAAGARRVREHAAAAERDAPADLGINAFAAVGRTDDLAYERIARALGGRFATREALLEATIAGAPRTIVERVRAYARAGLNAIDLKLVPLEPAATLDEMALLAREVLPAFA